MNTDKSIMKKVVLRFFLSALALALVLTGCGGTGGGKGGGNSVAATAPATALTTFSLNGVTGTINETNKTVAVTMPFGTNVTALVATFATTGVNVKVGATTQVSGITSNDFTGPVNYTVTAADGTTASYAVTVAVASNFAKAITAFSLAGVTGTINETNKTIALTVPFGSNITALVATFTTTGAGVTVGNIPQVSGVSAQDFTYPASYTVTAADGTTASYAVTVAVASSPAKAITAFSLAGVSGTINETNKTIAVTVPFGTNITALVATFTTTGLGVMVGNSMQFSGMSAINFSSPVSYVAYAADGSTVSYIVTVAVAQNSAKAITAFSLAGVTGTINETSKTIAVTMPFGTNVTALVATFATTGNSIVVGATSQISGFSANNFTTPVIYTVTAADGSSASYTVTVNVAPSSAKTIIAFALNGVTGTINEMNKTIAVTVPFGTNITALVATFTTTGVGVKVGATAQISGTSANNFTGPVSYTVTAADGTTVNYSVTVTIAVNSAKAITAFSVSGGLAAGTINEANKTIAVSMPFGTNVTALNSLAATFATTGVSVKVGATAQISGTSANNFTNPVIYTVTAGDGTSVNYSVTVTIALNPAKVITQFALGGVSGTINEVDKAISVPMTSATNVTALVATFTSTGTSIQVGATAQVSGTTANDFTNPVTYIVTAADGTTAKYRVTVLSQSVAYQIDPSHSGAANFAGTIAFPAAPTWSVTLSGAASYPLIAGGKVFVLTAPGALVTTKQLYALNKATGAPVWGPIAIPGTTGWAGHAYDNGKVFVVNYDGLLSSFDANTGAAGWSVQLTGQYAFSAPPTAVNGIVYVGGAGSGGTLYAVDETSGSVLWTKPVANGDKSSPTVFHDGVVVSYPCQLYKFDLMTGAALWYHPYGGGCSGAGGLTVPYISGTLYVRDRTNLQSELVNGRAGAMTSVYSSATLISALTASNRFALNAGTLGAYGLGAAGLFWSFTGDGQLVSAPIAINQYVIVGSASGNVYALNSVGGTIAWTGNAGAAITAPDEQNVIQPLTGFGAGEGYLIVPAGAVLTAWSIAP